MTTYIFNGSKIGLLTCIFDAYYEKRLPNVVTDKPVQTGFCDYVYQIENDAQKAERVTNCLKQVSTPNVLKDLNFALKSGEQNKFTIIFNYLKTVIDNRKIDVSKNFANPSVLAFNDLLSKITKEIHRFKGFIRFEEAREGYLYAHYSPENDITWMLMPHFTARLANQAFIIHDTKRNLLAMYDGESVRKVDCGDGIVTIYLSDEEVNFKKLWQTYYDSVNIKERKNHRLMKSFLPIKFWKNLPEKCADVANF